LRRLSEDSEAAAKEYETIRRKLALFFEMRGNTSADSLADDTIDRVARRLDEGEVVSNLRAYFYGVARRVLLESERRSFRERGALDAQRRLATIDSQPELEELRVTCLKRCLLELPEDSRNLILAYYEAGRGPTEEARKLLADRLGISYGNLKIRAHRIRGKLEACLNEYLAAQSPGHR
jgi:RNA polymerase sigma factor (sigma-70 family)